VILLELGCSGEKMARLDALSPKAITISTGKQVVNTNTVEILKYLKKQP